MNIWYDMLMTSGIDISSDIGYLFPSECTKACAVSTPEKSKELQNAPHHYNAQGKAVFTTDQIHRMRPESYGFTDDYEVIESQPTYEMTYNDEVQYKLKPKHHYCLRERFRFILNQLCGHSGVIPDKILEKLRINHTKRKRHNAYSRFVLKVMTRKNINENNETVYEDALNLNDVPRDKIWEHVRDILKKHKLAKYYNRIPAILGMAGYDRGTCTVPKDAYNRILCDFDRLAKAFNDIKEDVGRKYFPSLRYIALKLMARHEVKTDWPITGMRTMHKKNALDKIYNLMWEAVNKREDAELEAFFSFLD